MGVGAAAIVSERLQLRVGVDLVAGSEPTRGVAGEVAAI